MSLDHAREQLLPKLEDGSFGVLMTEDWPSAERLVLDWWDAYQKFERDDTFDTAWSDQRMSLRWCGRGLDFSFKGVEATRIDAVKNTDGSFPSVTYGNLTSNVGVKGVMARLDPKVFLPYAGGVSRKTELGLHDLSASILRSNAPITKQLFNAGSFAGKNPTQIRDVLTGMRKDAKGAPYYVFMPLSKPADQKVFHFLNDLAKQNRNSQLYPLVREIRSKMTRVKLACEHDMGTGFLAAKPDNPVNPKFRYGHQKTTKERVSGSLKSGRDNSRELIAARKSQAMAYDQMLKKATGVNEVTIAYRYHDSHRGAGEHFPLAAELTVRNVNGNDEVGFQCFLIKDGGVIDTTNMRWIPNEPTKAEK
jgi:hypothetical protein